MVNEIGFERVYFAVLQYHYVVSLFAARFLQPLKLQGKQVRGGSRALQMLSGSSIGYLRYSHNTIEL